MDEHGDLVDDLASLTKLDEAILVEQLHLRYDEDRIYVRETFFELFFLFWR